jgi:hypothetical protein
VKSLALVGALVAVGLAGLAIDARRGFEARPSVRRAAEFEAALRWSTEIEPACEALYGARPLTFCSVSGPRPEVLVLGDSHANQLYPGLATHLAGELSVVSAGNGPPLDGVAISLADTSTRHAWFQSLASLADTRRFIERQQGAVKVAVVGGMWDALANGTFVTAGAPAAGRTITLRSEVAGDQGADEEALLGNALARTFRWLIARGVRPVLVTDAPELGLDPKACGRPGRALFGDACGRPVPRAKVDARQRAFRRVLARLQRELPELIVFDTLPTFCDAAACRFLGEDGMPLYRDEAHLSRAGSERVGRELARVVLAAARAPRP